MKKILLTGCNGQLGLELNKNLKDKFNIVCVDKKTLDIADYEAVDEMVGNIKPDIIINAAAYTKVDLCETNQELAYRVNTAGPENLAKASYKINSVLVHISTDYVFDGNGIFDNGKLRAYIETDKVNPQSIYGVTKLQGERDIIDNTKKYFIIRTAWLYGDGDNFVKTMVKLSKNNDTVKVVNDQTGSPTSTKELSNMIEKLIKTDNYGLYHGTCEGSCTWFEFTKEIYRLLEIKTKVIPVTTDEFPRPAKRPKFSILENQMLRKLGIYEFKKWQDALAEYIASDEMKI